MNIKNLKVVAASLCLGATLLTGCGDRIPYIGSNLTIEDNKVKGNISYADLDKHAEIVSFEESDKEIIMLCLKTHYHYVSRFTDYTSYAIYDLESGTTIIEYTESKDEVTYLIGESLSIKEELPLAPYLISENFLKSEYTVEELIEFFNEKVKPSLTSKEKELVK